MGVALILSLLVFGVALVGCPLAYRRVRAWARETENMPTTTTERVHRLRRAQMIAVFGSLAAGLVLFGVASALQGPVHAHHPSRNAGAAGLLDGVAIVIYLFGFLSAYRAIRPSYVRVRGIDRKAPYRWRMVAVLVVFGLVAGGTYTVAVRLAPHHGAGHVFGIAIAYGLAILIVNALLAPLWMVALKTQTLPPDVHRRLMALNQEVGAHVRDIKSFPSTSQKMANALQVGLIPGLRYILISDYLMENMDADEVDAVVGHELGHARGNHLLVKLLGVAAIWAALEALSAGIGRTSGFSGGAAGVALLIGFPIAFLLGQGLLGVHLERKADDAGARLVGSHHLGTALEKLGDLNHTRLHTSWTWNLLGQHPGLDERIARLRETEGPAAHGNPPVGPERLRTRA
jgi:STE24 endopeptidase